MKTQTQVKTYDQIRADIAAIRAKIARDKARPRIVASSLVDDREKAKQRTEDKQIQVAVRSLTSNLPTDPGLNSNYSDGQLMSMIADYANRSAIEGGVFFVTTKEGNIELETPTINIQVPYKALEQPVVKLFNWSKVGHVLKNSKGELAGAADFYGYLAMAIAKAKRERAKLKPSSYYLTQLVTEACKIELQYQNTAPRKEVVDLFLAALVKVGAGIGFEADKRKNNLYIQAYDNRMGATELNKEMLLPYFQRITNECKVAGKFLGTSAPKILLDRFVAAMPCHA